VAAARRPPKPSPASIAMAQIRFQILQAGGLEPGGPEGAGVYSGYGPTSTADQPARGVAPAIHYPLSRAFRSGLVWIGRSSAEAAVAAASVGGDESGPNPASRRAWALPPVGEDYNL